MDSPKLSNATVSRMLSEVAAAYEAKGENRFKIRAYSTAADSVEHATSEVRDLWEEGRLSELPGIGTNIASHLDEYFRTGKVQHFAELKKGLPPGMFEIFGIEGIGPKRAFQLAAELGIRNIADLYQAAQRGEIAKLEGFGERSQKLVVKAIERRRGAEGRIVLPVAFSVAEKLIGEIGRFPGVVRADPLGSLRRMVSTVGDIDIGIATTKPAETIGAFNSLPDVGRVLVSGKAKASVVLKNGYQVDIRAHDPQSYGALLQYFTGSKQHNIHLRKIANTNGLSLSEYGIAKYAGGRKVGDPLPVETEEDFYGLLGMGWIPPEIREDTGEIEAAQNGTLPKLVEVEDIEGEVHIHSLRSDGEETVEEMVEAAVELGHRYLGISDHAPSVISRGLGGAREEILKRKKEIDQLRKNFKGKIELFFGAEVNINARGKVALPDELLSLYEYTIGAIHTSFDQPREMITERLLAGLKNSYVNVIAHPTGRLLGKREAYEVDWGRILTAAVRYKKVLEINSYPYRLDLPDDLVRAARGEGIRFLISTDAHHRKHYANLRFGVAVARRGWCERKDIVNAYPAVEFAKLLGVRG
ncbi:MAG: DNA polymerase/3'-5' exonuclease PolX [Patescibacteria group bacterium]|nr:MAG: DNA polymerase/3'-5' exonuclease PolX [Patescibacteria group bacterium]